MNMVARLVAAVLVAAATVVALPGPAAYAAPCGTDTGVTVVVDFNQLGGGVQQQCVAGGGGDAASSLFPAAGFTLKYAQRQPGFVCRVNDVPQSDPCVNTAPADAFWSLWWSDGDGSWTYASVGAASLRVPDGGFVAFSWDQVSGSAPPSAGATTPAPPQADEPSPDRTGDGSGGGDGGGGGGAQPAAPGGSSAAGTSPSDGPTTGPTPSAGDSPTDDGSGKPGKGKRQRTKSPEPEPSPGSSPTAPTGAATEGTADDGSVVADPASGSGGLPGWVAPVLIGVLFAAASVVMLIRRRRAGP
jgi:hypothetical protein